MNFYSTPYKSSNLQYCITIVFFHYRFLCYHNKKKFAATFCENCLSTQILAALIVNLSELYFKYLISDF